MTIEFVMPWGIYSQGQRLVNTPYEGMANELVRRNIAKIVVEEAEEPKRGRKQKAN